VGGRRGVEERGDDIYERAKKSEGEDQAVCTDGLVEAHDPKGEMFGFPRLRALVAERGAEEERLLGDVLMEELYSFVGKGWEQEDDIILLTLECSPNLS
jgi:serine phosphatase RsbU (regulator of sigma subunit)